MILPVTILVMDSTGQIWKDKLSDCPGRADDVRRMMEQLGFTVVRLKIDAKVRQDGS